MNRCIYTCDTIRHRVSFFFGSAHWERETINILNCIGVRSNREYKIELGLVVVVGSVGGGVGGGMGLYCGTQ